MLGDRAGDRCLGTVGAEEPISVLVPRSVVFRSAGLILFRTSRKNRFDREQSVIMEVSVEGSYPLYLALGWFMTSTKTN